jgi:ketosteroid isomerase-like protein
MSANAEELIRQLCDALNANDVDRASRLIDPEVVVYGTRGGMDQDIVLRGRGALIEYWNDMTATWESLRYDPERIIESDDLLLVFWRETARSARGDLEFQSNTATIFNVGNGKILEIRGYMDRDEALEVAGLTE